MWGNVMGRCCVGSRFTVLLELEKKHLQQKVAEERARRDKVEKEVGCR